MSKVYYIKHKDDLVGTLEYPSKNFLINPAYEGPLPLLLFPWKSTVIYKPTKVDIESFLADRIIQEDNQALDIVLGEMNLSWYSVMPIIDETYGMLWEDNYWVLPEEFKDLDFKTNHIRGILNETRRKFLEGS